jgi:hypothetical protein
MVSLTKRNGPSLHRALPPSRGTVPRLKITPDDTCSWQRYHYALQGLKKAIHRTFYSGSLSEATNTSTLSPIRLQHHGNGRLESDRNH